MQNENEKITKHITGHKQNALVHTHTHPDDVIASQEQTMIRSQDTTGSHAKNSLSRRSLKEREREREDEKNDDVNADDFHDES